MSRVMSRAMSRTTSLTRLAEDVNNEALADNASVSSVSSSKCGVVDLVTMRHKANELHALLEKDTQELFDSLDNFGNNFLTPSDVKTAFQTFDMEISWEEVNFIMDAFDTSGEGHITFSEFRREMKDVMMGGTRDEHIKLVFNALDNGGNGFFGVQEVIRQFQKLGAECDFEDAVVAFNNINSEGDQVDLEQFRDYVAKLDEARKLACTPIIGIRNEDVVKSKKKTSSVSEKVTLPRPSIVTSTCDDYALDEKLKEICGSDVSEDSSNGGQGGLSGDPAKNPHIKSGNVLLNALMR